MSRTGDLAELQPVSFASLNTPNLGRQGKGGHGLGNVGHIYPSEMCIWGSSAHEEWGKPLAAGSCLCSQLWSYGTQFYEDSGEGGSPG